MSAVYYTLAGIALYFGADWVLKRIEKARGARFENREIIYFGIILALAIVTFQIVNRFAG
jgi:hypothetical protein